MKNLVNDQDVTMFRERGYLRVRNVLSKKEVADFRQLAEDNRQQAMAARNDYRDETLHRVVNAWRQDPAFKAITFHPAISAVAGQLAGEPLRLWHDQVMIKPSHNGTTFMHQGQSNWSHHCRPDSTAITAWIALVDVPLEAGCMGYIAGSHKRWNLGPQMGHVDSFFDLAPDLIDAPVEFVPLKAGDVAFHHANTVHCAAGNEIGYDRIAATINFMDCRTTFRDSPHAITDGLGYVDGQLLDDDELFPIMTDALVPAVV